MPARRTQPAGTTASRRKATSKLCRALAPPPHEVPHNARLLICGYFDGVEQCKRDTAGGYFTSVGTDSEALAPGCLTRRSSKIIRFRRHLAAPARVVAFGGVPAAPRVASAHSCVRQTPIGRPRTRVGKQPSITRQTPSLDASIKRHVRPTTTDGKKRNAVRARRRPLAPAAPPRREGRAATV